MNPKFDACNLTPSYSLARFPDVAKKNLGRRGTVVLYYATLHTGYRAVILSENFASAW